MESGGETWKILAWAAGIILTLAATIKVAIDKIVPMNKGERELIKSLQRDMIEVTFTLRTAVDKLEHASENIDDIAQRVAKIEGRLNGS